MLERLIVSTVLLFGQLASAFVQLCGHLAGLFGGTTERHQNFREFGNFHFAAALVKARNRSRALTRRGYIADNPMQRPEQF
jgi:hypothetical protein